MPIKASIKDSNATNIGKSLVAIGTQVHGCQVFQQLILLQRKIRSNWCMDTHPVHSHFHREGFHLPTLKHKRWRKYGVKENLCLIITPTFPSWCWGWHPPCPAATGYLICIQSGAFYLGLPLAKDECGCFLKFHATQAWKLLFFFTNRPNKHIFSSFMGIPLPISFWELCLQSNA